MRKVLKQTAIATAALLAGITMAMATPGMAQASGPATGIRTGIQASPMNSADCPDNYLCLWGDVNYTGRYIFYPNNGGDSLWVPNIGDFMNDLTSSIWNRTPATIFFFEDINYGGHRLLYVAGEGGSSGNVGADSNDRISSFHS
jgi:hypothetical protein